MMQMHWILLLHKATQTLLAANRHLPHLLLLKQILMRWCVVIGGVWLFPWRPGKIGKTASEID
jgi:hypothetical protein